MYSISGPDGALLALARKHISDLRTCFGARQTHVPIGKQPCCKQPCHSRRPQASLTSKPRYSKPSGWPLKASSRPASGSGSGITPCVSRIRKPAAGCQLGNQPRTFGSRKQC